MARGHGRILTSIWEDADFLALDERGQRLYLFLISQPNLNHAGLLDLTLRRWARKASGLTVAELEERIAELAKARFVVVDEGTEELLIRSFVRNDGVWRMPKVMGAMVSGALEISSPALRRALLDEMGRVPLDELSAEPTKTARGEGPSIRSQIEGHIETLRRAFGNPTPDPTEGGSTAPSEPPSETPSDTPAEGGPKGSTRGRAGTHMRAAPALTPAPAPSPSPDPLSLVEVGGETSGSSDPATERSDDRPTSDAPIDIDGFALNDGMRRWARDAFPKVDIDYETAQFIDHFRGNGSRRPNWYAEWQKWIRRANKWADERQQHGNVVRLQDAPQRRSTTDDRVAAGLALAAKYRAEEERAALETTHPQPQESA
ncbi:hypothetical protein ACIO6U_02920 [Streptomyces sp. NPDC087422]|uniref:hypothetical protein n=1 Tax=Streptomyces sp. NPDC087422 TaxID=3365786 RepID=UPI00382E0C14